MAAASPIQTSSNEPKGTSRVLVVLRIAILALIGGGSLFLLFVHREWLADPRMIKQEVLGCGAWGPIAYILLYAVGPSFLVPGAVMTIAGGLAFGAVRGALWSVVGANLGALVAFGAGRFLGRSFVEHTIGSRFHRLFGRLERNGFYITLYLRIVPVIPYNAFNLLAGASPITFRDYFWASVIGMIPGTVLFAVLGDALWHPASPRFFIAIGLILLCFGAGEIYRRRQAITLGEEVAT